MTKAKNDRNFDSIAGKFQKNIYATSKGKLREKVLQRDLAELPQLQQTACQILDVGAGQGQLALWLAEQGHQVHLTDVSAEMLAMARNSAAERGLLPHTTFSHAPMQHLVQQGVQYPIVLCHAVLEWMADAKQAIADLWALTAPGGILSLMFYNIDAKRFSNIVYGNFNYVLRDLTYKKKVHLSPQNPLDPQQVRDWCIAQGFVVQSKTGVRCFHDYLRDRSEQETEFEQLLAVELRFNRQEPYASLGRYQHLILHKPA